MTTTPATDAVVAPATRRFERLEFGKFCVTRGGPVENMESAALAHSAGFPADLVRLCRPDRVNLGHGVSLSSTTPGAHGTIVRPLLTGGRVTQIVAALGPRSEKGDTVPGRPFWLGRFLLAAEPASPVECLTALRSYPWGAPLRSDLPRVLSVAPVNVRPPAAFAAGDEAFLETAIVSVVSGIPVYVVGGIGEQAFFRLVDLLWHRLPPSIRPLFGYGWGVTEALARNLSVAAVRNVDPHGATFDMSSRSWTLPTALVVGGATGTIPFDVATLTGGRMYLREVFGLVDGRPDVSRVPTGFTIYPNESEEPPRGREPLLLGLLHGEVRRRFRAVGNRAIDHTRARDTANWLAADTTVDAAKLCLSTGDFFSDDIADRVGRHAVDALSQSMTRERGDEVIWRSLGSRRTDQMLRLLDVSNRAVSPRARLLGALWQGDAAAAMAALDELQDGAGGGPVNDEILPALQGTLEKTVAFDYADRHARLLRAGAIVEPYSSWVSSHVAELAVLCASIGHLDAVQRLSTIADHRAPVFDLLQRWLDRSAPGGPVTPDRISPPVLQLIEQMVVAAWVVGDATAREAMLAWVRWCSVDALADPLWVLVHESLDERVWPPELGGALTEGRVPPSLLPAIAALLVTTWPRMSAERRPRGGQWNAVFDQWPAAVRFALTGTEPSTSVAATDIDVLRCCERPGFDADALGKLAALWARTPESKSRREAAKRLLGWIRQLPDSWRHQMSAVALCAGAEDSELPIGPAGVGPNEDDMEVARRLLAQTVTPDRAQPLWEACTASWQFEFVLRLFPSVALVPNARALDALMPLRTKLRDTFRLPSGRALAIVASDFHNIPYPGKGDYPWQDFYRESVVWAAFSGVPLDMQGDLSRALAVYGRADAERVRLATRYVRATSIASKEDRQLVVERVVSAVLTPLASASGLRRGDLGTLFRHFGFKHGSRWSRFRGRFRRSRIVRHEGEGPSQMLWRDGSYLHVSSAVYELMVELTGVRPKSTRVSA
jgi:hypothetical protein